MQPTTGKKEHRNPRQPPRRKFQLTIPPNATVSGTGVIEFTTTTGPVETATVTVPIPTISEFTLTKTATASKSNSVRGCGTPSPQPPTTPQQPMPKR